VETEMACALGCWNEWRDPARGNECEGEGHAQITRTTLTTAALELFEIDSIASDFSWRCTFAGNVDVIDLADNTPSGKSRSHHNAFRCHCLQSARFESIC
jgi:hypothetical protein